MFIIITILFSLIFFLVGFFIFGSYLTYSHTKEYKKISFGALAEFSQNQNLNNIECKDYYNAYKRRFDSGSFYELIS